MHITRVVVSAGRTFNHPHEQFSNLRPEVTLEASFDPDSGEDRDQAVKTLQAKAEGLVEDHKQSMLKSIEELYLLSERQAEMRGLQRELEKAQSRLDELRKKHPELKQLQLGTEGEGAETAEETEEGEGVKF